jgi:thiamine-monophosphate kinase
MSDSGAGTALDRAATMADVGERGLLRHLRSRIPLGPGVLVGVGDDAAAVETGALTLITTDVLIEGVHFRREWGPANLIGRKALTVNLSDIAAMAGVPRYAVVSLSLPADTTVEFLDMVYDGLLERSAEAGVAIVGGNVSATPGPLTIDVTLLGHGDKLLRRDGAKAGDLVVVTGTLGAAAAGPQLPPRRDAPGRGGDPRRRGHLDRGARPIPWCPVSAPSSTHAAPGLRPRPGRTRHRARGHGPLRRPLRRPPHPLPRE